MTKLMENDGEGTLVARRNKSEPISDGARGRDKDGHLASKGSKPPMPQHIQVQRTGSNSSNSSAPGALASGPSPRHSGVMPDLVPPHTPPQSRSPPTPQRPQDKSTSEEYRRAVLQPSMRHQ